MRWRVLITNSIVLAGITWMVAVGFEKKASKLIPSLKAVPGVELADIASLEERASFSPSTSTITALVTAYLDREQPGLASAVIERAPAEVRREPMVAQLHARALFQRGRAREALAVAKEAHEACVSSSTGERLCPSWLVAKTTRQLAFFDEVVAAGIEDPYESPGATKAAYEKSAREVRLVAVR
jgi:hypothetical protein